ncbi:Ig-like domain-containing protein [Candidatus Methanoperedens nitratireducens]|nr:Ig-like domain-containing protein [Candidatus Methanoperedens nitroreducens]
MALVLAPQASAYPSYATETGASCGTCHVDPNGGGTLTPAGEYYKLNGQLPPAPTPTPDTPTPTSDTPPVIAITSPTDGQTFTTDAITVNGTASDDIGVSKVEVKVGAEGSYAEATGNTSWSSPVTLASGSNTIYARATDTSGNTTETSVNVTYSLQTPSPDTPPSTAVNVTFTVIDNETGLPIAGAKVSMNGSKIKTDDTGTAIFTNLIPGDYKYKVSAEEYEKSKDHINVTGDMTVTVKLVPETEEDEDDEDITHVEIIHWLENIFKENPCTGVTAGIQNSGHAGEGK